MVCVLSYLSMVSPSRPANHVAHSWMICSIPSPTISFFRLAGSEQMLKMSTTVRNPPICAIEALSDRYSKLALVKVVDKQENDIIQGWNNSTKKTPKLFTIAFEFPSVYPNHPVLIISSGIPLYNVVQSYCRNASCNAKVTTSTNCLGISVAMNRARSFSQLSWDLPRLGVSWRSIRSSILPEDLILTLKSTDFLQNSLARLYPCIKSNWFTLFVVRDRPVTSPMCQATNNC